VPAVRAQRVDAQRNVEALLAAAKSVFAGSGVDAPAKQITDAAGVGVGTLYRHFPLRSDLVIAVLAHEVDALIELAPTLAATETPDAALSTWLAKYTAFVATKHGLAEALHSGDPAFDGLPLYFLERLGPPLDSLLDGAIASGGIRSDVSADDLLRAVAHLCVPGAGEGLDFSQRMIALLLDGMRFRA